MGKGSGLCCIAKVFWAFLKRELGAAGLSCGGKCLQRESYMRTVSLLGKCFSFLSDLFFLGSGY